MRKKLIVLLALLALLLSGCAELERKVKDVTSSVTGLKRQVSVYADNGQLLRTYTGRLDVEPNEYGNKVKFELNGKRYIVYNAIVIVEELPLTGSSQATVSVPTEVSQ